MSAMRRCGVDDESYIIVGGAGDRGCHYWISTASFSLRMTQSAMSACGQSDGGRRGGTSVGETDAVGPRHVQGDGGENGEEVGVVQWGESGGIKADINESEGLKIKTKRERMSSLHTSLSLAGTQCECQVEP